MTKPISQATPRFAGLELTLACPCRCATCGSGAGKRRDDELTTEEWLGAIRDLAALDCRRVTFLGGEAFARPDWPELAREVISLGMALEVITSGMPVDQGVVDALLEVGVHSVTVSVDGTREAHDAQRGIPCCFDRAMGAIEVLDRAGLRVGVTTQVNQKSLPTLEALAPMLQDAGAMGWQLQLTMPAGGAGDALVLPPAMVPEAYRVVRALVRRPGLRPFLTNGMGYMTDDDPILRSAPGVLPRCWLGCFAGVRTIGIASDGTVRGCLALPYEMHEGNLREESLATIWGDDSRFAYVRCFEEAQLSGPCGECEHGRVCRGGCTALSVRVHGRPGICTHCMHLQERDGDPVSALPP